MGDPAPTSRVLEALAAAANIKPDEFAQAHLEEKGYLRTNSTTGVREIHVFATYLLFYTPDAAIPGVLLRHSNAVAGLQNVIKQTHVDGQRVVLTYKLAQEASDLLTAREFLISRLSAAVLAAMMTVAPNKTKLKADVQAILKDSNIIGTHATEIQGAATKALDNKSLYISFDDASKLKVGRNNFVIPQSTTIACDVDDKGGDDSAYKDDDDEW